MGRAPCCDKANVKRGPWSPEEDAKLKEFIEKYGTGGNWIALPGKAGLRRCGKSCRLRWLNYLRPNIKHGEFSDEEDRVICTLYTSIGSRWSIIAAQLPGRTDNDIKNYWNTKLKKKLMGLIPSSLESYSQPFSGTLQAQSQHLPSPSQLYSSINTQANNNKSLTALDSISAPQNILYSNSNKLPFLIGQYSYDYQPKQECSLADLQYYPVKDNMMMLGRYEASCSSSDGSCRQISCGQERVIKQEEIGCRQGLIPDGFDENHKFMLQYCGNNLINGDLVSPFSSFLHDQKPSGVVLENSQMQYDLDEVKQLIAAGSDCSNNFLFNDENKTGAREMNYY